MGHHPDPELQPGVDIYAVAYGEGQLPEAILPDPPTGWTVDLAFTSPTEVCYEVLGVVGASGGEVEIEVLYTPEGGSTGRKAQGQSWGQAGNIALEGCFQME